MNEIKWSEKLAESIMQRTPLLHEDTYNSGNWAYENGVILKGFQMLWEQSGKQCYFDYIENNMKPFITESGAIKTNNLEDYNLDNINNGKALFILFDETKDKKYQRAAERIFSQIKEQPRTDNGLFWHKKIYPYQVWLDGLYMSGPFYAEYAKKMKMIDLYPDILKQFSGSYQQLCSNETGLLHHAWDEKKVQPWADVETGLSENYWTRSIGWYLMAVTDVYELLSRETNCEFLADIVQDVLEAVMAFQDSTSKVWYQVTNEVDRKGNYLEASGSSMIVYAIAKAIRLGILDRDKWQPVLLESYQGLIEEFILVTNEGYVNLNKNCQVAGLGGSSRRDGSYAYYISEPIVCNDHKGLGAFLQAAIEVEGLQKSS